MKDLLLPLRTQGILHVLLLMGTISFSSMAQTQVRELAPTNASPLWQVDLKTLGYKPLPDVTASLPGRFPWIKALDFTDDDHLAWAWLTLDNQSPIRLRSCDYSSNGCKDNDKRPQPEPAHLHVLFLNAKSGDKNDLLEWPTPSFPVGFLGLPDGKFITCNRDKLHLFSPMLDVILERDLPPSDKCYFLSRKSISPSGRLLLRRQLNEKAELVGTETLSSVQNLSGVDARAIGDHWFVVPCGQPARLCLGSLDYPNRPLRPLEMSKEMNEIVLRGLANIAFADDETIVIKARTSMSVFDMKGSALFDVTLPKKQGFNYSEPIITSSVGGERFAVIEDRQRGLTSEPLDMYSFLSNDRVVVYSIPDRRPIFVLKVKGSSPWPPWRVHLNSLALSPDGTLLAVVSDDVLKVYRLPGSKSR